VIIATAGHVDHGKTALIRALTGTDTDRLPEEKRRGLSIDLGFAYQTLPDEKSLGFVDVPGHEKFIRNMLAGVGGIDLGLLVVAADDGVMPQTREHFAILNLLGIEQSVVAITKIDRVEKDRVVEVQQQIEALFGDAGREDIRVYAVCAPDNEGVDVLKDALAKRAQAISARPLAGHFRMAIDRVFTLKGVGIVVTGMVFAGSAGIDDKLVLSADRSSVRVREIRAHDQQSDRANAGERCAINIVGRGVSENSVRRGDWLIDANLFVPCRRIDVNLSVLASEPGPLKHWTPTHLHIGSAHFSARVAVLEGGSIAAGEQGLVQLVLEQNAFVVHGDRFVLRDQSAQRTIAGGSVIDPCSPRRGRAKPTRIETLRAMNRRGAAEVLAALTEISQTGVSLAPFAVSHNLTPAQTEALTESAALTKAGLKRVGRRPEERLFSTAQWQRLCERIEAAVSMIHQSKPELPGASLKDIQLALKPHVEAKVLEEAINLLLRENQLGCRATRFHLPSHKLQVAGYDRQLWALATPILAPDSGSPLSLHQAAEALSIDRKKLETSLKNALKIGEMVLVSKNRYLPASYLLRLALVAEKLAAESAGQQFTVADYCAHVPVGRNFAIELLEYFDRQGFTDRSGNNRRIRLSAAAVFAFEELE
jgi:selenocysteine-specific elongation factor